MQFEFKLNGEGEKIKEADPVEKQAKSMTPQELRDEISRLENVIIACNRSADTEEASSYERIKAVYEAELKIRTQDSH